MRNLQISEDEFLKEIQVVMEERRLRTDDQSSAVIYEQLMAAAFANSPYKNPIIGWMADLKNMTYQDAIEWYQTWYAPNNAVLVVTGDVSSSEVLALAEKYYGSIPSKPLPARKLSEEIPQIGTKRIQVKAPAENPDITLAWKVPKLSAGDLDNIEPYALDVLSAVLDGHPNSRLNKIMVHDSRIADHVSASYDSTGRGPQLFLIEGSPAKGKKTDDLEKAFRKILMDIRLNGVTDAELNRIKSQIFAAQIYKRDSVFGQAMEIGSIEMDGISWRELDHILEMTQKVNSKDIQSVVEKYLIDDGLTVAVLDPQPINKKEARTSSSINGLRH
jgi:zinc protease